MEKKILLKKEGLSLRLGDDRSVRSALSEICMCDDLLNYAITLQGYFLKKAKDLAKAVSGGSNLGCLDGSHDEGTERMVHKVYGITNPGYIDVVETLDYLDVANNWINNFPRCLTLCGVSERKNPTVVVAQTPEELDGEDILFQLSDDFFSRHSASLKPLDLLALREHTAGLKDDEYSELFQLYL